MEKFFNKVLCPIDFSNYSESAVKKAASLVETFHCELIVAHIIINPWSNIYTDRLIDLWGSLKDIEKTSPEQPFTLLPDILLKVANEMVHSFAAMHLHGINCEFYVNIHRNIHQGIIDCAGNNNVDLIVMSTHGRTGHKRIYFGSVTENVVRRAPCSVLVVRN